MQIDENREACRLTDGCLPLLPYLDYGIPGLTDVITADDL
jgi:hypothetical protein